MQYLAIDIDGKIVNICQLSSNGKIIEVSSFDISNVKQLYIKNKDLHKKNNLIASSIYSNNCIFKSKKTKIANRKALKKTIFFQATSIISIDKENCVVDANISSINTFKKGSLLKKFSFLSKKLNQNSKEIPATRNSKIIKSKIQEEKILKSKDQKLKLQASKEQESTIYFYITTKDAIKNHLDKLKSLDISPDFIHPKMHALARFSRNENKDISDSITLHIGRTFTEIVKIIDNHAMDSYIIPIGKHDFYEAHKTDSKNSNNTEKFSIQEIDLENTKLNKLIKEYLNEIEKGFLSLDLSSIENKLPIFFTGIYKDLPGLKEELFNKFFKTYFAEEIVSKKTYQLPYAIAIGSAIDIKENDSKTIQFLQNELTPQKHIKNVGKFFMHLLLLSIFISSLYIFVYQNLLSRKKETLINNFQMLKKYKTSSDVDIANLNFKNLNKEIYSLRKKIKKELLDDRLMNKDPKVYDLLQTLKISLAEYQNEIKILSFNYEIKDMKDKILFKEKQNKKPNIEIFIKLKISNENAATEIRKTLLNTFNLKNNEENFSWKKRNDEYQIGINII